MTESSASIDSFVTPRGPADGQCLCTAEPPTPAPQIPRCECPRDDIGIAIHEETCALYKNETIIYPHTTTECECPPTMETTRVCECCGCLEDQCHCKKAGREAFDEWRANRDVGEMPAVLESTHPLMQKFQDSLSRFLEKENALAENEIVELRDELRTGKIKYDTDLETIYRSDHDTNSQRALILEYEKALEKESKLREEAEKRARIAREKYQTCKEKLHEEMINDHDSRQEFEALTALVRQLEAWREEMESDLTINQRMSDKIRKEKKTMADEKRELDMIIYSLNNEVWKLESKLELFKKQMEIKNIEMEKVTDKVTAYSTELEDLELDKKRLVSLWNSVLVNIKHRDKVFNSVREDYRDLKENFRTMTVNLEITKRMNEDVMQKSKLLEMNRDKLTYDIAAMNKLFEARDERRVELEAQIVEITESIEMSQHDHELIALENNNMGNMLTSTQKDFDRRVEHKLKLENEILDNIQDCLLNDKATESMAKGIKKMRDMSRKIEISLMDMENQHAKLMLNIEIYRNRQAKNQQLLDANLEMVRNREKDIEALHEKYSQKGFIIMQKQREYDIVLKKYNVLKDVYDLKSPQERRIEELDGQIRKMRDRTDSMQHEWLRLQGHVVKLSQQHQKLVSDISLINKQIQICDQKSMSLAASLEQVRIERLDVERALRDLRGRLEVLQRTRKDSFERTQQTQLTNLSLTHEYSANLKTAESELIDMEEEIEALEKGKTCVTQNLDRMQKEALVWQRKGILAVELKKSIHDSKSAAGEIGQMKNEIHRMEVRREQLRLTADKLSEDLALYVMRREAAMEKTRASAAIELARGHSTTTSQTNYKHKLRLIKADVARVTKDLADAKANVKQLQEEHERLEKEIAQTSTANAQLEENVASLLQESHQTERDKQWLLERVVRSQRMGNELARAVKRQSLRIKKPKDTVLQEFTQAKQLNERVRYIVHTLVREYPYMEHQLGAIANTLNIYSPSTSPRLTDEATCDLLTKDLEPGCVIKEEVVEEEPVKPCTCSDTGCKQKSGDTWCKET